MRFIESREQLIAKIHQKDAQEFIIPDKYYRPSDPLFEQLNQVDEMDDVDLNRLYWYGSN